MEKRANSPLRAIASLLALLVLAVTTSVGAELEEYPLGAGDLVRISVFEHPEMAADLRVDEAGTVSYPLVGALQVEGLSTRQVESLLEQRLATGGFIRNPQVSVLIAEYVSRKVAVMGEVAKPGQYVLTQASRALELLAQAGGVVTGVGADNAVLLRADGSSVEIDLHEMFRGNPEHNPAMAPGDTLYVPRAAQFYIYGEVQRPGTYRLERNMTVSQAISAGGGLTPRGTERRATVKRRDAEGNETEVSVKGSDLLKADDVLLIKESLF